MSLSSSDNRTNIWHFIHIKNAPPVCFFDLNLSPNLLLFEAF